MAEQVGEKCPETFDDIENLLRANGYFPPLDVIFAGAGDNPFLAARYELDVLNRTENALVIFLVRDFGFSTADRPFDPETVKSQISATGLNILQYGTLTEPH